MLPLVSFETGRKTQTQSYGQPHQLRQQMEVWFYSRIETIAERPTRRAEGRKEFTPALLPKRVRRTFCLLTQTYHGSRFTGTECGGHQHTHNRSRLITSKSRHASL